MSCFFLSLPVPLRALYPNQAYHHGKTHLAWDSSEVAPPTFSKHYDVTRKDRDMDPILMRHRWNNPNVTCLLNLRKAGRSLLNIKDNQGRKRCWLLDIAMYLFSFILNCYIILLYFTILYYQILLTWYERWDFSMFSIHTRTRHNNTTQHNTPRCTSMLLSM